MKKKLAVVLSAAMIMGLCGTVEFVQAQEQVELEVAYWGDKAEIATKTALLEKYEEEHPNVKINKTYTDGGTYQAKLQMWFSSGKAPDVLGVANDLIEPYKDMGVIENLKPYMEADGLLDGTVWEQSAVDSFSFGENIFAAPYVYKDLAIAYNKDLFEEASVPFPTAEWTETEFLDAARKLTKGEGIDKQWGVRVSTYPSNFYRNMFGTPIYDVLDKKMTIKDNEGIKYAITLFSDMVKEGLTPNETFDSMLGAGFETGKYAMAIVAPWDMASLDSMIGDSFQWDIEVLPKNEKFDTTWKSYLFADGYSMFSECKNKEAAWNLIKWLTATEEAQKVSAAAGVPMYLPYASSDDYLNNWDTTTHYNKKVFVDMLKHAVGGQTTGAWAQINDELNLDYQMPVADQMTVDEVIDTVDKRGTQILESVK